MQTLVKKISMLFLIVSLGWFPIQVTFATSFVLPNKALSVQNNQLQDRNQVKTAKSGCKMHKAVQACCSKNSVCSSTDQECGHCISFIAMTHDQQTTYFIPKYSSHTIQSDELLGLATISAYRPPRVS